MGEEQIAPLRRGCEVGTELCDARDLILEFVESRMEFIAPNVCRKELSKLITNLSHTSHNVDQFFLKSRPKDNTTKFILKAHLKTGWSRYSCKSDSASRWSHLTHQNARL